MNNGFELTVSVTDGDIQGYINSLELKLNRWALLIPWINNEENKKKTISSARFIRKLATECSTHLIAFRISQNGHEILQTKKAQAFIRAHRLFLQLKKFEPNLSVAIEERLPSHTIIKKNPMSF